MSAPGPGSSPLVPGYKLDRYELLAPIAEGGMASVWIARQRGKHGFEKLVAIKTILPRFAEDLRFQQMFLDEARIASRIDHANVAHITDLGEEHEVLFLAMEWIDGEALSKLFRAAERRKERIPHGVALRVLADTLGGLHAAHELRSEDGRELGVVHRDVSPQNILLTSRGVAKLIDFGIAKARDRVAEDTNTGLIKGKIQYMAPEQALGQPIDRRADVFAVGAIAYHLLSGRAPYEAENQLASLHLLGTGHPPLPLPGDVHPAICAVVMRALEHVPDHRHPSAAAMQAALESAMLEARIPTTTADVAAYAEIMLADRVAKRRQAVELALKAAVERARVASLLRPASPDSSAGMAALQGTLPAAAGVGMHPNVAPLSERSNATLGSAAVAGSVQEPPGRSLRLAVAVLTGLCALLGATAIFLATHSRTSAAFQPPSSQYTAPVPSPSPSPSTSTSPSPSTKPAITGTATGAAPKPPPAKRPPAPARRPVDDGF